MFDKFTFDKNKDKSAIHFIRYKNDDEEIILLVVRLPRISEYCSKYYKVEYSPLKSRTKIFWENMNQSAMRGILIDSIYKMKKMMMMKKCIWNNAKLKKIKEKRPNESNKRQ